jgi:hypothetical protein
MPDSGNPVDEVQIGDHVTYRLSMGDPAYGILGRVIAAFHTQDGKAMADVEWDKRGVPKRLNITHLIKA